jgi:glycosyltransferase involved in cell wall biosynthesis
MTRDLKLQARYAVGAAYVTRSTLQQLYPCGAAQTDYSDVQLPIDDNPAIRAFATHYSTVELGTGAFVVQRPRPLQAASVRLITVGTFEQLYKGPDILIDAVALCISFGLDICVRFVGTGKHLEEMRRRAIARQLGNRVEFTGQVECRRTLIELLDSSDIFVLPSRTEGLPRAMIEAMARGLPCVGTSVGGIPELLDDEDLVPPNDATALARKIDEVLTLPERLARMSRKNLDRAREYAPDRLASRRNEFYRHVGRAARILSPNPNMVPRTPAV